MNTTISSLLGLIAKTPMMRAVQIADRLDITVDVAEAALRDALVAGHVIEHEVEAPNRRKAMAYELSAQYMGSTAFKNMTSSPDVAIADNTSPTAQGASLSALKSALAAPVVAKSEVANYGFTTTKVEKAISFIKANGQATSEQLHAVLGLGPGQYASGYLGSAIRSGQLARDGKLWVLPKADPATMVLEIPKLAMKKSKQLEAPVKSPPAPAPAEPAPATAARRPISTGFRAAIWSDGILELQRDGATIAALSPLECNNLATMLIARGVAPRHGADMKSTGVAPTAQSLRVRGSSHARQTEARSNAD